MASAIKIQQRYFELKNYTHYICNSFIVLIVYSLKVCYSSHKQPEVLCGMR